jgi:outer membrane protein OmpA-like peptidoglycan-associated protein
MSWNHVVPKRSVTKIVALAFALCLLGTYAAAQVTLQPKVEIFGGYSWLHPNGYVDWGKVPDITHGWNANSTFYLPQAHNLGIIVDGSGHYNSNFSNVGLGSAGLQYKWHNNQFSPFGHVLVGAAKISPAGLSSEWRPLVGAGGGFDLQVTNFLAIRVAQADYFYTTYNPSVFTSHSSTWNMVRLSAGLTLNLGNYYTAPVTAACTAQPATVMQGEPVKVTTTGTNFNPKHSLTYAWTSNGGKLDNAAGQTATIDTTGVSAGSYTANATISDAKLKKGGSASCSANYTVNVPPPPANNPPRVSCSVNPQTVVAGNPVTINTTVTSPDNAQITGVTYTATAGKISGTGNTATHDTTGVPAGQITVTATATDARNLTGSGSCSFEVTVPPQVTNISSIQFPDKKRPWRVDNTAKAILDDVASRMKADPNAKIAIVGYADGETAPKEGRGKKATTMDLAAQRAVNAKAYLVQQQGIDPSRIDVRKGTGKSQTADIDWIPQGADAAAAPILQGTTPVDESMVKPSTNAYPMPHAAAPVHHRKAKAPAAQ